MPLQRTLGFWDVFCLAAGAMISSGLFVLPGLAFVQAGPSIVFSYALAGFLMIPAALSAAELATGMPRSGGHYFHIERSMGQFPGLLAGLANWFSDALKSAFALIGIGAFAPLLGLNLGEWTIKWVAVGCCVLFAAVNLVSVKSAGWVQTVLVVALLAILAAFAGWGLAVMEPRNFDNFMPNGLGAVLSTTALVSISYGGLTKIASVAEEIRQPARNIPAGMFLAAFVVTLLYIAAVMVTVGVLGPQLSNDLTPLSTAARRFSGPVGGYVMAIGAMLAFITTANGGILTASRNPLAMARDGLLPARLQKVSPRFHTPQISVLLTSGFMVVALLALPIVDLVKMASTMLLLLFILLNAAVIIMRTSGVQNYQPKFRSPAFPWVQIGGVLAYGLLVIDMGRTPLLLTTCFVLLSLVWYLLYIRGRIQRESALIYLVKGIISRDLARAELDEELREIAIERDEVVHDRFDHLVRHCQVLDLPNAVTADQVFRRTADMLGPRLGVDSDLVYRRLLERESQSSTVVQPTVAIPHIVVPGEGKFDLLMIRSRGGVQFPGRPEPVKVIFVLAGTADERNYHLRALMAIAHIVQEHEFLRRWLDAGDHENLRDIALMSTRKRDTHG